MQQKEFLSRGKSAEAAFCFPGQALALPRDAKTSVGIAARRGRLCATQAGTLRSIGDKRYWINCPVKRYTPAIDDLVLGVVVHRSADYYKVGVGSFQLVHLGSLAFSNATKRNRPVLQQGDLVYGQITRADSFCEPEMTCNSRTVSGLGHLKDGALFDLNIARCRELLLSDELASIGRAFKYSAAVGINGKVWVRAERPEDAASIWARIARSEASPWLQ